MQGETVVFFSGFSLSVHHIDLGCVATLQVQHFFTVDVGPSRSLFDRITALITAEALNQPAWTDRCLLIARTAYQLVRLRCCGVVAVLLC
jgi:hypothetical protein